MHATLLESIPLTYELLVGPLTLRERDRYCSEAAIMEPLLGMPAGWLPRDSAQLDTYMREMLAGGSLVVTDTSRALARALLYPPQWHVAWPAFRAMQLLTIGSLPPSIREAYGFEWRDARRAGVRAMDDAGPNVAAAASAGRTRVADGEASRGHGGNVPKNRNLKWPLLALVTIGASAAIGLPPIASAKAGAVQQLAAQLDAIAGAGVREDRSVGLVAAVVKGNETLLLKAYGKSDVEGDVPMTVDTVIAIGSDTKQFTAAAILQLRDQGKLGLDDEITKWLPDFDTRGNKVTLRHLLGHTSGVTDLVEMPELRAMKLMRNPRVTREEVYKVVSRYAFMFPTGTMQVYSNTVFWLLGLVIEKASGMTYEDYVETKIFDAAWDDTIDVLR